MHRRAPRQALNRGRLCASAQAALQAHAQRQPQQGGGDQHHHGQDHHLGRAERLEHAERDVADVQHDIGPERIGKDRYCGPAAQQQQQAAEHTAGHTHRKRDVHPGGQAGVEGGLGWRHAAADQGIH